MLVSALQSVLSLLILIAVGFFVQPRPWFKGGTELLSSLMTKVIFPVNVLTNVLNNFSGGFDPGSFVLMGAVVLGIHALSLAVGWCFATLLRVKQSRKSIFICATAFPNIILLGFPFVESIYSQSALQFAVVFFIVNTTIFWTVCPMILSYYGDREAGAPKGFNPANLKKLINPSLMALGVGIIILSLGITLPTVLKTSFKMVAGASTPLAMIFIGSVIRGSGLRLKSLLNRDMLAILLLKIVVVMGVLIFAFRFIPIDPMAKRVFLLLVSMPVCVNLSILAHQYKSDYQFCALVSTAANLICVLMVPVFVVVFGYVF